MASIEQIAKEINADIEIGKHISQIKSERKINDVNWQLYTSAAYALNIEKEKRKRKVNEKKSSVATTSTVDVESILELNVKLANYAILLPVTATLPEFVYAAKLADQLPNSEQQLLKLIERLTMQPLYRARQKKGRFEHFPYFRSVAKLIDAATLCYYRQNYISCYLTLVPVIEGIMLRWLGYNVGERKPKFKQLQSFFSVGYQRQPMPWNIQFHEIFSKGCSHLLAQHFFRDTGEGNAYNLFNRHVAAHLLEDGFFATKSNCLRLFMLLDAMSEIYFYESRGDDPLFSLHNTQTDPDMMIFETIQANSTESVEKLILES